MIRHGSRLALALALFAVAPRAATAVTLAWENSFGDGDVLAPGSQATAGGVVLDFTTSVVSDNDGGTFDLALYPGDAGFVTVNYGTTGAHDGYARMAFNNENDDPADYVLLTISFSYAVTGLQFSVLDIDSAPGNAWDDGVEVTYNGGLNVRDTPSLFTLPTAGATVVLDNEAGYEGFEAIDTQSAASGSTSGNVDFDFGTTAVTDVTIRYFSTNDARNNPGNQLIGISDLSWLPIPEPATAAQLALGLTMLGVAGRRRRARR